MNAFTRRLGRRASAWLVVVALGATALWAERLSAADSKAVSAVGRQVANFVLPDKDGKQIALADYGEKQTIVLFFIGTGCPIANLYLTELSELEEKYPQLDLQIIGINSNAGVTPEETAQHAEEFKVGFPVLLDADQGVANSLGAKRTAEVFVLDSQRKVRYHGRVDDRFGYTYKREDARRNDLKEALSEMLAGKEVSVPQTEPMGCLITQSRRTETDSTVTYAKEVSRILQRRCQECHRPGMVAPFTLTSYEEARDWTAMMKEVVVERRMPPWHADPRYGEFSSDRSLSQEEIDTLVTWIDSGAPLGDEADLPEEAHYVEGWQIDDPDLVFYLPEEQTIQADGVVPYLYFSVPSGFEEDVWVQAAECRPDNRAVVHHLIAFYRNPETGQRGRIHGFAPGEGPLLLPPGVGRKIPAGSEIMFQMHYTPTGKVEKDRSMVGLILCKGDAPPEREAFTKGIVARKLEIPPHDPNYRAEASHTFERDALLWSMMPHMHLRGKDFKYTAVYPDGTEEILLSVPAYDFNWQNTYRNAKPKRLPAGTRIDCVAHYDNSEKNPANPAPDKTIRWGQQTWDEMMIGYVHYMWADPDEEAAAAPAAGGSD